MRRLETASALLAGLLLLTACGSGDMPTVAAPTPGPSVGQPSATATATATATAGGAAAARPGVLSAWKACEGGFTCATLTVPLDDAKPAAGTVGLALTRRQATGSNRIGSLIVNPGGPGASAVGFLQAAYTAIPAPVRGRFDLVAFDPRGVGRTAPVRCLSTAELDRYFHIDPVPNNASERAAIDTGNREFVAGCTKRSSRVLPYVSTRIVAQDLDRVRQAVGDAKLTYLGYSYGTAIGASYLAQYPTRVRAMVLDGALDPTLTWDQLLAGQSKGFDVALNAFLANCQSTRCAFRTAVSGDLTAAYDRLAASLEAKPLPGDATRTVGPGEFSLGVGAGLYSRSNGWPAIAEALARAVGGQGDALLALSDGYLDRSDRGYANVIEANFAVNCIDRAWPRTDQPYYDLAARVGKAYPRFGPGIALSGLGCATWPIPPASTPHAVSGSGSPPIVVIGTTRDPATPYVWAQALATQLSHGVLLTHNGDGHTVYRVGSPGCIVDPVNTYLLTGRPPVASTC